ncbi:hypothetical protein ACK33U_08555 [Aeromonas jandaei]|uniref:hypothetical protein n=1 Tax=Aeromonas jandaei TaxID=650 RepID=UPI003988F855
MIIECPKCSKKNDLHIEAKVKCGHCQEELTGHTFKKKIMSGGTILAIGIISGQVADYALLDNRYPMSVEYSIVDACTNADPELVSKTIYLHRKDVCLCAMKDTMNEISYIRYNVDKKSFLSTFQKNTNECIRREG